MDHGFRQREPVLSATMLGVWIVHSFDVLDAPMVPTVARRPICISCWQKRSYGHTRARRTERNHRTGSDASQAEREAKAATPSQEVSLSKTSTAIWILGRGK